jgi:hypothetical protein
MGAKEEIYAKCKPLIVVNWQKNLIFNFLKYLQFYKKPKRKGFEPSKAGSFGGLGKRW